MKKFLKILVWVLTAGAIITGMVFVRLEHINHPLQGVQMTLDRADDDGFIDYYTVYQDVINICDTTNNTDVTKIPVDSVRNYLKTIPWATYTDANISLDEVLIVNIIECQAIMRVFNRHGKSVYLDSEGRIFPINSQYVPHVLIGSGYLNFPIITKTSSNINDEKYKDTDLPKMFEVMKSVLSNSYSINCVKQVYLAKNRQYELAMNNTDLEVILGDDSNVDEKLLNLQYFFEQMQGNPELKNYYKINFNFENQVVLTKNKTK